MMTINLLGLGQRPFSAVAMRVMPSRDEVTPMLFLVGFILVGLALIAAKISL
jgi:hypothetical protein